MDAKLKADWVAALRSGEYSQADGVLHHVGSNSYCCLGVLCRVLGASVGPFVDDEGYEYDVEAYIGDRLISVPDAHELSAEFANEIGVPDQFQLMSMNDGCKLEDPSDPKFVRKHNFAEIADWIEANIPSSPTAPVGG